MGSYDFQNIVTTTDDVETAYDDACSDALHEQGLKSFVEVGDVPHHRKKRSA